ncbi:MAG: MoaD/ThiS family protein [Verrucomicrobia bacterium]|nr:MoaD/ThiS family protein [Verrucomicrobiota bacterium]
MTIQVRFFSFLRDLTGDSQVAVDVPDLATVEVLINILMDRYPKLREARRCLLVAVDLEYQALDYKLADGDEVCLFPPVQGG